MVFFTGRAGVWRIVLLMNIAPYPFVRIVGNRYEFTSLGKREIQKVVEFVLIEEPNVYNLCFGDSLPGNKIDDRANTNNGDIVKVFATVIAAVADFLERNPKMMLYFTGSTESRTNLYAEILRRNYSRYKDMYQVSAAFWQEDKIMAGEFDPSLERKYIEYYLWRRN